MKFDRNTVLGFVILAALFIAYFVYTNKEQAVYRKNKAIEDSISNAARPKVDTLAQKIDSARADTVNRITNAGGFKDAANGTEQVFYAENELMKVAFTNKGGQPKWVELKNFKNQDSGLVKLAGSDFDKISYSINTGGIRGNSSAQTGDLFFPKIDSVKNPDGSKTISFTLRSSDSTGSSITHQFILKPKDYMVDFNVLLSGADNLLSKSTMNLTWQYTAARQESNISFERQNTQVGYVTDGDFDYNTILRHTSQDFEKSVKWVGVRQRFFFTILVAKE